MTTVAGTQPERARDQLRILMLVGVSCLVVGSAVAISMWPREHGPVDQFGDPGVIHTGSWLVAAIGSVVTGAGQIMVLIAIIGYGVMLGRQAARPGLETGVGQDSTEKPDSTIMPEP